AARNSSAYGARNVQKVAAGTGEALPGPAICGHLVDGVVGASRLITGDPGKWVACRVGVGGGRSTGWAARTTQPPVREGPLLRRCVASVEEWLGECPCG